MQLPALSGLDDNIITLKTGKVGVEADKDSDGDEVCEANLDTSESRMWSSNAHSGAT